MINIYKDYTDDEIRLIIHGDSIDDIVWTSNWLNESNNESVVEDCISELESIKEKCDELEELLKDSL